MFRQHGTLTFQDFKERWGKNVTAFRQMQATWVSLLLLEGLMLGVSISSSASAEIPPSCDGGPCVTDSDCGTKCRCKFRPRSTRVQRQYTGLISIF